MTRRFLVVAASLTLPATAAAQAPAIVKYSAGGITVIQKTIMANDVVAARLYLKGGSAALTPATSGIERLIGAAHAEQTNPPDCA